MTAGSVHISYEKQDRARMYEKYKQLILRSCVEENIAPSEFTVLDLASGRGELLQYLTQAGIPAAGFDIDEECVRLSSEHTSCTRGDINEIDKHFAEGSYDMVVLSHVIEHLRDPLAVIKKAERIARKRLLLAVPNPIRPRVITNAIRRRIYSNKGHVYAWDYSHFINFLSLQCELNVTGLDFDEVKIPGKYIRKFFNLFFFLNFLELKLLPKLFPYFSTSLIALVKKV